ncbi:hypothetical protein DFH28DRAFT_928179 [Melampsora americana]|nr:hypothetical protein DFH28DRAFT_928179 [Melampsora americana]
MSHSTDQKKERVLSLAEMDSAIEDCKVIDHQYLKGSHMLGNKQEINPLITPISLQIKGLMHCGIMNFTSIKELLQITKEPGIQQLSLETLLCATKPNLPENDDDDDATLQVQKKNNTVTVHRNCRRTSIPPRTNQDSVNNESNPIPTEDSGLNDTGNTTPNDNCGRTTKKLLPRRRGRHPGAEQEGLRGGGGGGPGGEQRQGGGGGRGGREGEEGEDIHEMEITKSPVLHLGLEQGSNLIREYGQITKQKRIVSMEFVSNMALLKTFEKIWSTMWPSFLKYLSPLSTHSNQPKPSFRSKDDCRPAGMSNVGDVTCFAMDQKKCNDRKGGYGLDVGLEIKKYEAAWHSFDRNVLFLN